MEEQDNIIELTGAGQESEEEVSRARTSSAKTTAAKKTASKTGKAAAKTSAKTAAKKPASSTAAKKPASSTAAKKPSGTAAAKKTAASAQPKLTAREKKLIQNYRKCGEAGKLMIDTLAEKTAEMGGKGSGSESESGLGSMLSSITQNLDLSSLTGLLGK
jgi:hypothetical protein